MIHSVTFGLECSVDDVSFQKLVVYINVPQIVMTFLSRARVIRTYSLILVRNFVCISHMCVKLQYSHSSECWYPLFLSLSLLSVVFVVYALFLVLRLIIWKFFHIFEGILLVWVLITDICLSPWLLSLCFYFVL